MSNIGKKQIFIPYLKNDTFSCVIRTLERKEIKNSDKSGYIKQIVFCRSITKNEEILKYLNLKNLLELTSDSNKSIFNDKILKKELELKGKIRIYKCINIPNEFNIEIEKTNNGQLLKIKPLFLNKINKNWWGIINKKIYNIIKILYNKEIIKQTIIQSSNPLDNLTPYSQSEIKLELKGVGYKIEKNKNNEIEINIGYSHIIKIKIPTTININIENNNIIVGTHKYNILHAIKNNKYETRIKTSTYEELTNFINNLLLIKPATIQPHKEKNKGKNRLQGFIKI